MVGSSTANRESFKVTTPSDHEICMTRLFNAPRRLVFEAMTKPEHVKQWWGRLGEGYSVPICETANTGRSRRQAGLCSPRFSSSFPTASPW